MMGITLKDCPEAYSYLVCSLFDRASSQMLERRSTKFAILDCTCESKKENNLLASRESIQEWVLFKSQRGEKLNLVELTPIVLGVGYTHLRFQSHMR